MQRAAAEASKDVVSTETARDRAAIASMPRRPPAVRLRLWGLDPPPMQEQLRRVLAATQPLHLPSMRHPPPPAPQPGQSSASSITGTSSPSSSAASSSNEDNGAAPAAAPSSSPGTPRRLESAARIDPSGVATAHRRSSSGEVSRKRRASHKRGAAPSKQQDPHAVSRAEVAQRTTELDDAIVTWAGADGGGAQVRILLDRPRRPASRSTSPHNRPGSPTEDGVVHRRRGFASVTTEARESVNRFLAELEPLLAEPPRGFSFEVEGLRGAMQGEVARGGGGGYGYGGSIRLRLLEA